MLPQFPRSTSSTVTVLLSLLLLDGVQVEASTVLNNTQGLTGFPPCDALISANLSHVVHLPSSPLYSSLVAGSWAIDTRKESWCFVVPRTTAEVSRTITALRSAGDGAGDWHVAIRSGGHGSDDSNNIANGVTIDLSRLNATSYDAATNVASVGTGARWGNVYADLAERYGVSVTGGRAGVVGVGGLVLGGGISWYSPRTGFACDSVVNYEVVLASGRVINANASANLDLWRALKGGGSNFGIVTRFDLDAFPARNLTIETRPVGIEHADEFIDAFVGFIDLDRSFHDNNMISLLTYDPKSGAITMTAVEINTMNNANTTAFDAFKRIPTSAPGTKESVSLAQSADSTQVDGDQLSAGGGILTIANDPRVLRYCLEQHTKLVAHLNATLGPQNFSTLTEFQPLPSYLASIGAQRGGNMLGLQPGSRNKIIFAPGVTLLGPAAAAAERHYPHVYQQVAAMVQRIKAFARSVGSAEDFVYLPYAKATQDPIGSYGAANVELIRRAAEKYDPHAFFQLRVPGGFKIGRVD